MSSAAIGLRVLLVDDDAQRKDKLEQAFSLAGHIIAAHIGINGDLLMAVARYRPDIICFNVQKLSRATLELLVKIDQKQPTPVLLFAASSDTETTRRAVRAGVSAYVVDGLVPTRLNALIEVTVARFELYQALTRELNQLRGRLADQRDIEKAKGVIMKHQKLDEAAAYGLLRRMAMDQKRRIGEVARAVLMSADVLSLK